MTLEDEGEETPRKKPYEIGYCQPPVATRWQKGQSGNPGGRKKGQLNATTDLKIALAMKVTLNGKKVSAQSAIFLQTVADAVKGNYKARQQVFELQRAHKLLDPDESGDGSLGLAKEDWDILRRHFGDDFTGAGGSGDGASSDGEAGDEEKAA